MTQELIDRYQPGGDIFNNLEGQYGLSAANAIAAAARTGNSSAITEAIANVRNGPALETSVAAIFGSLVTTDPLGAPLDGLNNTLKNTVLSLIKNPFVIGAIALGLFFAFGGADFIRRKLK